MIPSYQRTASHASQDVSCLTLTKFSSLVADAARCKKGERILAFLFREAFTVQHFMSLFSLLPVVKIQPMASRLASHVLCYGPSWVRQKFSSTSRKMLGLVRFHSCFDLYHFTRRFPIKTVFRGGGVQGQEVEGCIFFPNGNIDALFLSGNHPIQL